MERTDPIAVCEKYGVTDPVEIAAHMASAVARSNKARQALGQRLIKDTMKFFEPLDSKDHNDKIAVMSAVSAYLFGLESSHDAGISFTDEEKKLIGQTRQLLRSKAIRSVRDLPELDIGKIFEQVLREKESNV